jgi:hypothetical protein
MSATKLLVQPQHREIFEFCMNELKEFPCMTPNGPTCPKIERRLSEAEIFAQFQIGKVPVLLVLFSDCCYIMSYDIGCVVSDPKSRIYKRKAEEIAFITGSHFPSICYREGWHIGEAYTMEELKIKLTKKFNKFKRKALCFEEKKRCVIQ